MIAIQIVNRCHNKNNETCELVVNKYGNPVEKKGFYAEITIDFDGFARVSICSWVGDFPLAIRSV